MTENRVSSGATLGIELRIVVRTRVSQGAGHPHESTRTTRRADRVGGDGRESGPQYRPQRFPSSSTTAPTRAPRNSWPERPRAPASPASHTLAELVAALARPRRIILMVKAGAPVDAVLAELAPLLDRATSSSTAATPTSPTPSAARGRAGQAESPLRRHGRLRRRGGRALGPEPDARRPARGLRRPRADARRHRRQDRVRALRHLHRPRRRGHYVKMVHNGIEYGDMQLIAETYDVMRNALGMTAAEMAAVFADWNKGKLASFLIEITAQVLRYHRCGHRPAAGRPDPRRRRAKGHRPLDQPERARLGTPSRPSTPPSRARDLSALRGLRVQASEILLGPTSPGDPEQAPPCSAALADRTARSPRSKTRSISPRSPPTPRAWRCSARPAPPTTGISTSPRSPASGPAAASSAPRFLADIMRAYRDNPALDNLLLAPEIAEPSDETVGGVRRSHRRGPRLGHPGAGHIVGARLFRHLAPAGACRPT